MSAEQSPNLDRAHWQRDEAMVVFSAFCDKVYPRAEAELTDDYLMYILESSDANFEESPQSLQFWSAVSRVMSSVAVVLTRESHRVAESTELPPSVVRTMNGYTYYKNPATILEEGFRTSVWFPINMAYNLNRFAGEQSGRPLLRDLPDMAALFRHPEFSTIMAQAATTHNGYWPGVLSRHLGDPPMNAATHSKIATFVSAPETELGYALDPALPLAALKRANSLAQQFRRPEDLPEFLSRASSSGCPVRHNTVRGYNPAHVDQLATTFETTPEQLVADRPLSGIDQGLRFLSGVLARTHAAHIKLAFGEEATDRAAS
jgi:hypothetical protein